MIDSSQVVLVDMDGVLADFDRAVVEALKPTCPDIHATPDSHRMYLAFPQYAEQIMAVVSAPGFFRDLKPIDDAFAGWHLLEELGYRPRICSSPLLSHPDCEKEKRAWLDEHLGERVAWDAYIVRDKCPCRGFALIDDIPSVGCAEGGAEWEHVVFDKTYNQHSPAPSRLRGWLDPNLPDLLLAAQSRYRERIG